LNDIEPCLDGPPKEGEEGTELAGAFHASGDPLGANRRIGRTKFGSGVSVDSEVRS